MQKRLSLCIVSIIGVIVLSGSSVFAKGTSTEEFVRKASVANEFEIESSRLALEKSQNQNVKRFAQKMIDDHTKAGEQLKQALQNTNTNAAPEEGLDDKHQQKIDKLQNLSGDDFDRQYIAMQMKAHKNAVSLFSDYSMHGKDAAIKSFAAQTLPTLKKHLKHVQHLKSTM